MKDAFRFFDKDGDGQITMKDLILGCKELGKKSCKAIFKCFCFNPLISLKLVSLYIQGESFDEARARAVIAKFDDNGNKLIQILKKTNVT